MQECVDVVKKNLNCFFCEEQRNLAKRLVGKRFLILIPVYARPRRNFEAALVSKKFLFSQDGPFSSEADIQRGRGLKTRYKISL